MQATLEKVLPKIELPAGVELKWEDDNIDIDHQAVDWFGHIIASVTFKDGLIGKIFALGDVRAEYFDPSNRNNIIEVKDKSNSGAFYHKMSSYIANDEELAAAIDSGTLIFDNNNWFECFFFKKDEAGELNEVQLFEDTLMNAYTVTEAVNEIIAIYDDYQSRQQVSAQ